MVEPAVPLIGRNPPFAPLGAGGAGRAGILGLPQSLRPGKLSIFASNFRPHR